MFKVWLMVFLAEKGIVENIDESLGEEFEKSGFVGFTHETLLDYLQSSESWIRTRIKENFIQIDFKAGDVAHFYNHIKAAYLNYLQIEFADFV